MVVNNLLVASMLPLNTRREYIHVALVTVSLLSTVLKISMETTLEMIKLFLVYSHKNKSCGII